ncbi:MAG: ABC-type transport auxiliary lipoprotein family protein [Steroidobacteraceae bacterium]
MKLVRIVRRAAPLVALLLGGCSGLLHSTAAPEQIYYLRAPAPTDAAPAAPAGASVRVGHPLADPGLDTSHIMLRQPDHRMSFYAGSRWPSATPDVVAALVVQTLRASGNWTSVEDSASPFPSDYLLQITVRRFDADYSAGTAAPEVHVMFDCIIGRREGREPVSSFVVSASAPAAQNRRAQVVGAFEQAVGSALDALRQQALQAVRSDAAHAAQNATSPAPSKSLQSQ